MVSGSSVLPDDTEIWKRLQNPSEKRIFITHFVGECVFGGDANVSFGPDPTLSAGQGDAECADTAQKC